MFNIHRDVDDTYGSPRMHFELVSRGYCVNHKRTERLMTRYGIYAKDGRRRTTKTTVPDKAAPPLPDLIKRDFKVGEPACRSCGDITYIWTDEGWLYLADVIDLGSRRIIGYSMDKNMPTELVASAMEMAIETRGGNVFGMTFHSDRGGQYMGHDFAKLCKAHGILQSVGRTGSCFDNAVAESTWASLKRELISRFHFATRADASRAIISWINHYNAVRRHSSLGFVSPIEWELKYLKSQRNVA